MKAVCSALGVARSNVMQRLHAPHRPRRQRMTDDAAVLTAIRVQIGSRPTYGYRRLGAVLNRSAVAWAKRPGTTSESIA